MLAHVTNRNQTVTFRAQQVEMVLLVPQVSVVMLVNLVILVTLVMPATG